jgi:hypothetical protein
LSVERDSPLRQLGDRLEHPTDPLRGRTRSRPCPGR